MTITEEFEQLKKVNKEKFVQKAKAATFTEIQAEFLYEFCQNKDFMGLNIFN